MRKNRFGYGAMIVIFAVFLYLYSYVYFLWVLIFLIAVVALSAVAIRVDASRLQIDPKVRSGGEKGNVRPGIFEVELSGRPWVAKSVYMTVKIYNLMFDTTEYQCFELMLRGKKQRYQIPFRLERCGEVHITCEEIWVTDALGLYRCPLEAFSERIVTVYPEKINLKVELLGETIGTPRTEGRMQNRRGNDPSQMFDIREYVPGDDIRSIHWKLSSKSESLILRQASEPSHYNVVILPDFGKKQGEALVSEEELQGIVAVGMALGEQLVSKRVEFCLALPTANGLKLREINSMRTFREVLPQWLACRIPEQTGGLLHYFAMEQLDQYFTKLLVLSGGDFTQSTYSLEGRIGVTVITVTKEKEKFYTSQSGNTKIIEVPASYKKDELYRILC